jgi:hypothetical protein
VGDYVGDMSDENEGLGPAPIARIHLSEQAVRSYAGLLGRPLHGFRWAASLDFDPDMFSRHQYLPATRFLVPVLGPADRPGLYDVRNYAVFTDRRCRELHRQFARLASVKPVRQAEEIRRFATRFGFLGIKGELTLLQPKGATQFSNLDVAAGEDFRTWHAETCEAAALVALWDLVQRGDRDEVARYVLAKSKPRRVEVFLAWDNGRLTTDRRLDVDWRVPTYSRDLKESGAVADERTDLGAYRLELFPRLAGQAPDVLEAARLFLFDRINPKLWGRVSPQLRAERPSGDALLFYPHSLLAAIYLYFVRELEGRSAPGVTCANPKCDQLIDASWNRKYCNAQCRDQARYYRDHGARSKSRRR